MILTNQGSVKAGNRNGGIWHGRPTQDTGVPREQINPEARRHVATNKKAVVPIWSAKGKKYVQVTDANGLTGQSVSRHEKQCRALRKQVGMLGKRLS